MTESKKEKMVKNIFYLFSSKKGSARPGESFKQEWDMQLKNLKKNVEKKTWGKMKGKKMLMVE
jgi:hypothetical protein